MMVITLNTVLSVANTGAPLQSTLYIQNQEDDRILNKLMVKAEKCGIFFSTLTPMHKRASTELKYHLPSDSGLKYPSTVMSDI